MLSVVWADGTTVYTLDPPLRHGDALSLDVNAREKVHVSRDGKLVDAKAEELVGPSRTIEVARTLPD